MPVKLLGKGGRADVLCALCVAVTATGGYMTTIKELEQFIKKGRKIQKTINRYFGTSNHSVIKKTNYDEVTFKVYCVKQNDKVELAKEPQFCPICGEEL
jgi:hypothetical protein